MGMDEAQAAKTSLPRSMPSDIREKKTVRITDHDVFNLPITIEEDPDLSANFSGQHADVGGQLL
jgi:hypothetical protein